MSDPARILVVQAASPRIAGAPDVAAEYRDIQRSIDAAPYRQAVSHSILAAVQLNDLTTQLIREVPAVLHISARGTPGGGLRLLTEDGGDAPVRDSGLAKLLCDFVEDGLQVVVLNACWTWELAEMLAAAVPCVIGTGGPIDDRECRAYSRTLYSSLAHGRSVGQSHRIAVHEADASGADPDCLPALLNRSDVIPDAVHLIAPEFRVPPVRTPVKPQGGTRGWLRMGKKPRL